VIRGATAGVLLALLLVAPASATTIVIGPDPPTDNLGPSGCDSSVCDATWAQLVQPTPGIYLTSPADGVITAWRIGGKTEGDGRLALRTIHPTETGSFTSGVKSVPVLAATGDGAPSHAASLSIDMGDYIGAETTTQSTVPGNTAYVFSTTPGGTTVGQWNAYPEGTTADPSSTFSNQRLQLNATVKLDVPIVSRLSRDLGPPDGGDRVTIGGDHLANASQVRFGGTPATITSNSNTRIDAVAPRHAAATVDVVVTTIGGDSPPGGGSRYTYGFRRPVDREPPTLTLSALSPQAFAAARTGPSVVEAAAVGSRVLYRVSEPVTTRFTVQRRTRGVKKKGRCVKGHTRKRRRRCTRWRRVAGGITRQDAAGLATFRFMGRLRGRSLKPGRYRLVAAAKDPAGNRSKPKRRPFRIKRQPGR
jgi:hypothetical protein